MANTILFIFEGERTEPLLLQSFQKFYFNESGRSLITATFGTTVYGLYRELASDEFLDVVEVLRERSDANREVLEGITREDISETYLFFDHDGHANNAGSHKITALLGYFTEETDQGKLYISYPMVEAVKHLTDQTDFQQVTALIGDNNTYKNRVKNEGDIAHRHLHELDHASWNVINHQNCMKAWSIVRDEFELPAELVSQMELFLNQLDKHITPNQRVAVVSAFPLLLLDYYGVGQLELLIGSEEN